MNTNQYDSCTLTAYKQLLLVPLKLLKPLKPFALLVLLLSFTFPLFAYDLHHPALTPIVEKAAPAGTPVTLVKDGKVVCAIVADRHHATHRGALKDAFDALTNAFVRATGTAPELIAPAETNRWSAYPSLIVLGRSDLALAAGVDVTKLPDDGFVIKTDDIKSEPSAVRPSSFVLRPSLVIAGLDSQMVREWRRGPLDTRESSKGTLFAVYDFCERFLGARYFFPGKNGTVVPHCENLMVAPVHYEDAPYFQRRGHGYFYSREFLTPARRAKWNKYLGTDLKDLDPVYKELMNSWRLGGTQQFFGMHSPDPQAWSRVHPDKWETVFYTTPSGNFMHDMKNHIGNYFKVTDLGLADLLMDDWKAYFASSGKVNRCCSDGYIGQDYVSFGLCDTMLDPWDILSDPVVRREKLITAADLHGDDNRMVMRNVYGRFYSYLCKRLAKELPGTKLGVMAYFNAREAPTDPRFLPLDNLDVIVCDGSLLSFIMDEDARAKSFRLIDGWYRALGTRPVQRLWLYSGTGLGCLSPEYLGEIPKLYGSERIGRGGFFLEFEPGGEFWHYFYVYYLAAKLKWNPNCDVDAIVKDLFTTLYGEKASAPLLKFHALLKANGEKYIMPTLLHPETPAYPLADLDRLQGYLDEAKAAAGDDILLQKRVGLLADCWPKIFEKERKDQAKRAKDGTSKNAQADNPTGATVMGTTMDGDPSGEVQTFMRWGERQLNLTVANAQACYPLDFKQFPAGKGWGAQNYIAGGVRSHGFFSHGSVFWPVVNGKDMRSLVYGRELVKPYAEGEKKGWEMAMELDGVKLSARFYLTPESRLLTVELVRDPASAPVRSATVAVEGIPSVTTLDKAFAGKTRREVRTATRLLQEPGGALTPEDRFLVLQDGVYDGTSEEKGFGPVAVVPDFTGVQTAKCDVKATERNIRCVFTLKPDFTVFRYQIFEETFRRRSNEEIFGIIMGNVR